ncbi:Protein RRC1-like [Cocos nucifera]|uniref:Protein RRC1-like n=1 Tax=Cocos nucifera TaxID=13894 RepID=A0A8K0N0C8_COCNU|nr:Protein RRC1-like [Cocos nucifera]
MGSSQKKIPFHRHREAEEARKKREEDEAARVYAEFVESFKADSTPGSKAFVRGGVIDPNDKLKADSEGGKSKDGASVPKKGSRLVHYELIEEIDYVNPLVSPQMIRYVPSFLPPASQGRDAEKKKEEEKPREKEKGKTRAIDKFLEELKFEQELREKRNQEREHWREGRHNDNSAPPSRFDELPDDFDPSGKFPGSFDDGDPQTTNLYVGNLSPKVDENFLLRTFGRFGPIASVKIMWPRTEEERRRQRNCGFVAFMNRADGQAAKDEMQGLLILLPIDINAIPSGVVVYEYELKIGWGKSVALPAQALPAPPPGHMAIRNKEGGTVIISGPDGAPVSSVTNQNSELVGRKVSGWMRKRCRSDLQKGPGQRWIPPPLPPSRSPEHEKESTFAAGRSRRVELERTLTDAQRDEFEDMLRALILERSQIKEAMGFALDNADAAGEVVEVLTESLTLKETPIPTKVARLMLVSDILHNSSAPVKNASAYRTKFEATLPDMMESFNDLYRSITGRITAEALKERVLKVLQVWADWFLFSDAYLNGLRATFLRSSNSGVIPFHSICGDAPEIQNKAGYEDVPYDGCKLNQDGELAMGRAAAMKELLGLPIAELERRCRHNGLSLCGGREMMVARLLYLEEAERERSDDDLKYGQSHSYKWEQGYEHDEGGWNARNAGHREPNLETESLGPAGSGRYGGEVIGVHGKGSVSPEHDAVMNKKGRSDPVLLASKWSREDDGSDDEDKRSPPGLGLSYSSGSEDANNLGKADELDATTEAGIHTHPDNVMNEEYRQKLRRLEVAVMEYRESLEEQGYRSRDEIEKKVVLYRRRLQLEFGLSDSTDDSGINNPSERTSMERKERPDAGDSARKRHRSHSRSHSPQRMWSDRERHRDRERSHEKESGRERSREKSGSREKDDHHDKDRSRERDKDRRRKGK